jgi:hypothetical protein
LDRAALILNQIKVKLLQREYDQSLQQANITASKHYSKQTAFHQLKQTGVSAH